MSGENLTIHLIDHNEISIRKNLFAAIIVGSLVSVMGFINEKRTKEFLDGKFKIEIDGEDVIIKIGE